MSNPGIGSGLFMQSWLGGEIEPYHIDSSRCGARDMTRAEQHVIAVRAGDIDDDVLVPPQLSQEIGQRSFDPADLAGLQCRGRGIGDGPPLDPVQLRDSRVRSSVGCRG